MTTHSNPVNEELPAARFRPVNLLRPPFHLPAPVCIAKDTVNEPTMFMMMSDLSTLQL